MQAYVDGSTNGQGAGVGIVLVSLEGIRVEKLFRLGFWASNNEAKYEALLACLRIDKQAGVDRLILLCVSRLIVNQVNGKLEAKE